MRIVGCPGGEAEDEHDVVWFWLEKGKSFECPVCSQYFKVCMYPSFSLNLQSKLSFINLSLQNGFND
ncbi:unnamed protein product [Brassica rapa]|uniref:Uncharacterized protein n=2 Tax=Brassica TaxID=3705 RepID=A0A3P6AAY2_BRACM|nr:unnamed protein product [Brassica napus]CAG7893992.1 unnamed protein product [Brassica rapa]CDY37581.1 BnaA02g19890D [Brassica napus]VDC89522.1 unnamed protein product [Brassica rapa]